jgi:hypothetical protein
MPCGLDLPVDVTSSLFSVCHCHLGVQSPANLGPFFLHVQISFKLFWQEVSKEELPEE